MSLLNDLTADMVSAMKNRDKETLATVRMLKAAVQNEQIEQGHDLTPDEEVAVMAREYKQRKESLEEFEQAGRQDLVDKTKAEMKVVEKYMPQQLSAADVKKIVDETIKAVNASSMKDFGKVMGAVMPKVKGQADGKLVNQTVKEELNKQLYIGIRIMCTSIIYTAGDSYFGRNLDLEISFGQEVVVTPRNYPFKFRKGPSLDQHYAITGMALVEDGYPLYFDGANEKGLGMAGLNFDGPCHYFPEDPAKNNVTPFEFIPYILGQCKTVVEARKLLSNLNLVKIDFSAKLHLSPLHWLIADKSGEAIVVESTTEGLKVYDNPVGVLTNNPEFPKQLLNLSNYQSVSPDYPKNTLVPEVKLNTYSRGFGSHFLPGGMDSGSRFVKEVFTKAHAPKGKSEIENITNYFHNLHAVEQQKGLDQVAPGQFEYTIYSDGINITTGTFYYSTYGNNQINAVKLEKDRLDQTELMEYPLQNEQVINFQN